MFRVISSTDSESLIDHLRGRMESINTNPITPFTCVLTTVGMERWIKNELAIRCGVSANIETPMLSRFIWDLLNTTLGKSGSWALDKSTLQLSIFKILNEHDWPELAPYLKENPSDADHLSLSSKIADTFDGYSFYRPDWLNSWADGDDQISQGGQKAPIPNEHKWQPQMWRMVRKSIEDVGFINDRAELIRQLMQRIKKGGFSSEKLPEQITLFGVSQIPQIFLDILQALGEHIDVTLYWFNPAEGYWADNVSTKRLLKSQSKGMAIAHMEIGNPLLSSFGVMGKVFFNQLLEAGVELIELNSNHDHSNSMLGYLQSAIQQAGSFDHEGRPIVQHDDMSIRIASSHSVVREIESLKDHLLALFENDPTLRPHDVVVMAPNIADYAPFVHQIFRHSVIPYSISDVSVADSAPIFKLLSLLTGITKRRLSVLELTEIVSGPAVLSKFNLTADRASELMGLAYRNHVRWGLRRGTNGTQHNNTWEDGTLRLIAGQSLGSDSCINGAYPFRSQSSDRVDYAKVALFLDELACWHDVASAFRPVAEWVECIRDVLSILVDESVDPDNALIIQDVLNALLDSTESISLDMPVSIDFIERFLASSFSATSIRSRFLAGAVNFTNCVPMRSIPFKVICLLGLNDTEFPRKAPASGLDLIAKFPRSGDRNPRIDDRYFMLETLLLAQKAVYFSYQGNSAKTNEERAPSTLLQELQRFLPSQFIMEGTESCAISEQYRAVIDAVSIRNALQPFSAHYFNGSMTSYSENWADVAISLSKNREDSAFIFGSRSAETYTNTVTTRDFKMLLKNPAALYIKLRYGAEIDYREPPLESLEPMIIDGLDSYNLKSQGIRWLNDEKVKRLWFAHKKSTGELPIGELSSLVLNRSMSLAEDIHAVYSQFTPAIEKLVSTAIEHNDLIMDCSFNIDSVNSNRQVVHYAAGKATPSRLIDLWVETTIAQAFGIADGGVLVSSEGSKVGVTTLMLENANSAYQQLVDLFFSNLERPLATNPDLLFKYRDLLAANKSTDLILTEVKKEWFGVWKYNARQPGLNEQGSITRLFPSVDAYESRFLECAPIIVEPLLATSMTTEVV